MGVKNKKKKKKRSCIISFPLETQETQRAIFADFSAP